MARIVVGSEWGGNLDIRDVCPDNRVHLPIFHPGALFYLGDVHASQGDTEFTGIAAETQATVRVRLDLLKSKRVPWLRIDKPGALVAVHAYRPLEMEELVCSWSLSNNSPGRPQAQTAQRLLRFQRKPGPGGAVGQCLEPFTGRRGVD